MADFFNGIHYRDPTAYEAMKNIERSCYKNVKDKFITFLAKCVDEGKGIQVHVRFPGSEYPEVICNPRHNVRSKKSYYEKSYDKNLRLINNRAVEIIDWSVWEG